MRRGGSHGGEKTIVKVDKLHAVSGDHAHEVVHVRMACPAHSVQGSHENDTTRIQKVKSVPFRLFHFKFTWEQFDLLDH